MNETRPPHPSGPPDAAPPDAAGLERVPAQRVDTTTGEPADERCAVVVETPLTIMVDQVGSFTIMCTPCDVEALAVGFAFSEGLICSADEIVECVYRPGQQVVGLQLEDPAQLGPGRNLIVTSSCGLCGSRNIDALRAGQFAVGDSLRLPAASLRSAAEQMRTVQRLFSQTGGTHAAAIFDADGRLLAFAEDIGRHNALDKAIGKCLLDGVPLSGQAAILSGRVSLELVAKAARARLEVVAGVSAPSSLAVEVAQRCRITLCGFVREQRATVFSHSHRIGRSGS